MIDELINIIGREALLFEEFLALLDRQKAALVNNDNDQLSAITREQQDKLFQSRELTREREQVVARIKQEQSVEGDLTVRRLIEFADESQSARLLQLRSVILELNDKITHTRNANALLLNQSREFIARTMKMLSRINHPEQNYQSPGAVDKSAHALAVDRRI